GDRFFVSTLKAVCPAEECVRLGRRVRRDRLAVEPHRVVELALHLKAVGLVKKPHRLLEALFLVHGSVFFARPRIDSVLLKLALRLSALARLSAERLAAYALLARIADSAS